MAQITYYRSDNLMLRLLRHAAAAGLRPRRAAVVVRTLSHPGSPEEMMQKYPQGERGTLPS